MADPPPRFQPAAGCRTSRITEESTGHWRKVIEAAARHGIMVDVHEPIKDTGERRTYPNMLDATSRLTLSLAAAGGQAIRIRPAR